MYSESILDWCQIANALMEPSTVERCIGLLSPVGGASQIASVKPTSEDQNAWLPSILQ